MNLASLFSKPLTKVTCSNSNAEKSLNESKEVSKELMSTNVEEAANRLISDNNLPKSSKINKRRKRKKNKITQYTDYDECSDPTLDIPWSTFKNSQQLLSSQSSTMPTTPNQRKMISYEDDILMADNSELKHCANLSASDKVNQSPCKKLKRELVSAPKSVVYDALFEPSENKLAKLETCSNVASCMNKIISSDKSSPKKNNCKNSNLKKTEGNNVLINKNKQNQQIRNSQKNNKTITNYDKSNRENNGSDITLHNDNLSVSAMGKGDESNLNLRKARGGKKRKKKKSAAQKTRYYERLQKQNEIKNMAPSKVGSVICKYFTRVGSCNKGDECTFKHEVIKIAEPCKYYLVNSCSKTNCQYYHREWPCKFFHLFKSCMNGEACRFSHESPTPDTLILLEKIKQESELQASNKLLANAETNLMETDGKNKTGVNPQNQSDFPHINSTPNEKQPVNIDSLKHESCSHPSAMMHPDSQNSANTSSCLDLNGINQNKNSSFHAIDVGSSNISSKNVEIINFYGAKDDIEVKPNLTAVNEFCLKMITFDCKKPNYNFYSFKEGIDNDRQDPRFKNTDAKVAFVPKTEPIIWDWNNGY